MEAKRVHTFFLLLILIVFLNATSKTFEEIEWEEIAFDFDNFSPEPINGVNNLRNMLYDGTILVYKTNEGHYGKVQILHYDVNISVKYVTWNDYGGILSQSDSVVIGGTTTFDFDNGTHSSDGRDMWWNNVNGDSLLWVPRNGAEFAIYDPEFDAITYDDIYFTNQFNYDILYGIENQHYMLRKGEIFIYLTNENRKGKFEVVREFPDLRLKWVTYNSDGTIFSQGGNLRVLPENYINLDNGWHTDVYHPEDIYNQITNLGMGNMLNFVRQEALYLMPYDPEYNSITPLIISTYGYEKGPIQCTLDQYNEMPEGTIIVYKTSAGNLGKLKILEFGNFIRFKFFTYNTRSGHYFGHNYIVFPGDSINLDLETPPVYDIEFMQNGDYRQWYTLPYTEYFRYDPEWRKYRSDDILNLSFTQTVLDGSPGENNQIPEGTILFYKTNQGNYGKLKILKYGYNLKIRWYTFTPDRQSLSSGSDLVIPGTYSVDLDAGVLSQGSDADLWWNITNKYDRHLHALNGAAMATLEALDIEHSHQIPKNFSLKQNYPNPFNPATTIRYQIPVKGRVVLSIYNLLGEKVSTLVNKEQLPGYYKIQWDISAEGKTFPSGIYILRMEVLQENRSIFTDSKKMILIK